MEDWRIPKRVLLRGHFKQVSAGGISTTKVKETPEKVKETPVAFEFDKPEFRRFGLNANKNYEVLNILALPIGSGSKPSNINLKSYFSNLERDLL